MEEITCAIVTYYDDTLTIGCGTGYYCGINTQLGLQGCVENVGNSPINSPPSSSASFNLGCINHSDAQNNCDQACSQFTSRLTCQVDQPICATATIAFDQQQFYSFYCASVDGFPFVSGTGFTPSLFEFGLDGYTSIPANAQPGAHFASVSSHGFGLGPGPPATVHTTSSSTEPVASIGSSAPRAVPTSPQSTSFSSPSSSPSLSINSSPTSTPLQPSTTTFPSIFTTASSSMVGFSPLQNPASISSPTSTRSLLTTTALNSSTPFASETYIFVSPTSLTSSILSSSSSSTKLNPPSQTTSSTLPTSGLSKGAAAGIGVGAGVAGLAIFAVLVAFLIHRRAKKHISKKGRPYAYTPANKNQNESHSPEAQTAFSPFLDHPYTPTANFQQATQIDGVEAKEMQGLPGDTPAERTIGVGLSGLLGNQMENRPVEIRTKAMANESKSYAPSELHSRHRPSEMSYSPMKETLGLRIAKLDGRGPER